MAKITVEVTIHGAYGDSVKRIVIDKFEAGAYQSVRARVLAAAKECYDAADKDATERWYNS